MSIVQIEGNASREVNYDAMKIKIIFYHKSQTSSYSIQQAMEQCEDFLNCLLKMGMSMDNITLKNDEIKKASYHEDDDFIKANREIEIKTKFDIKLLNRILELISKKDYNVTFDYSYVLTNKNAIHEELLAEALADSQKKAELIARQLGKKVIGIDKILTSVEHNHFEKLRNCLMDSFDDDDDDEYEGLYVTSNQLNAAYSLEKEKINVNWIIE